MGTLDSVVGSGSLAESTSLNIEVRTSDASNAVVSMSVSFQRICHYLHELCNIVKIISSQFVHIESV